MLYLVTIQKLKDGSNPISIFSYNESEAFSAYHSTLASCYANSNLSYFCVSLIDELGNSRMTENHTNVENDED